MSFRNRAIVESLGLDDREQCVCSRAGFGDTLKELMTKLNLFLGYRHVRIVSLCEPPQQTLSVRCPCRTKGSGFWSLTETKGHGVGDERANPNQEVSISRRYSSFRPVR